MDKSLKSAHENCTCKTGCKSKYFYLSDDSKKDKEWDKWRSDTQAVYELLKLSDEKETLRYAKRMQKCSKFLLFKLLAATSEGEIKQLLKEASFCRCRHCPVCQSRRARRNYTLFLKFLEEKPLNSVRWVFLTLTAPNVHISKLRDKLKSMNTAWDRFTKRKEFKNVLGWVRSTEITKEDEEKNKREGYAHPHFHVLMMVKSTYFFGKHYINRDQWLKAWREAMRDDSIISVDVRIADRHKGKKLIGRELMKSVSETLKYSVKPSDMVKDLGWLIELIKQVHKLRFLAAGGRLKGIFAKQKLTNDEMIHAGEKSEEGEEVGERWYWWRSFERRYARKRDVID